MREHQEWIDERMPARPERLEQLRSPWLGRTYALIRTPPAKPEYHVRKVMRCHIGVIEGVLGGISLMGVPADGCGRFRVLRWWAAGGVCLWLGAGRRFVVGGGPEGTPGTPPPAFGREVPPRRGRIWYVRWVAPAFAPVLRAGYSIPWTRAARAEDGVPGVPSGPRGNHRPRKGASPTTQPADTAARRNNAPKGRGELRAQPQPTRRQTKDPAPRGVLRRRHQRSVTAASW